jgi:hypothetical protein
MDVSEIDDNVMIDIYRAFVIIDSIHFLNDFPIPSYARGKIVTHEIYNPLIV